MPIPKPAGAPRRPMAMRRFCIVSLGLFIGACAQAPMKPSTGHIQAGSPAPAGTIPAPVQISTVLPKPRPSITPETYSVVVDNVDAHELLFALARDAKLNIDVQPGITGRVTLNAINQTLEQLLTRIARQVDIRWELHGPNLSVLPDKPFLRSYIIDYPALERRVLTTVDAPAAIATAGAPGGGGGAGGAAASSGSSSGTKITITQSNTFWASLAKNVEDLIREEAKFNPLMVSLQSVSAQGTGAAASATAAGTTSGSPVSGSGASTGAAVSGAGNQQVQGQAAVGTVTGVTWVIPNAEAGVLWVRATSRLHEKVQEYLDQVLSRVKRQVLIEATIAEVQLNNQYQRGIDWSLVRHGGPGSLNVAQSVQGTTSAGINSSLLVLNYAATGVGVTLRLLESFGNVRVLSSPKISVLNNQTAILKVVDDLVYFTVSATTSQAANVPSLTSFTTTPNHVSVGFVMNVTPQISDTDSVLLNVRPIVSRVLSFVNDPNPSLGSTTPNRIPQIQTREMESMIRVDSGQVAVMGGLIQDSNTDNEDTVPGLSQIPGIGSIFSNRNRTNGKTELVIFIRPIVVRDPSIDGDFRALRDLAPDANFMSRPNPGKPPNIGSRP